MSKRKTVIELQSKPENKAVRQLFDKTKPVDYAPLAPLVSKNQSDGATPEKKERSVESDAVNETVREAKKPPAKSPKSALKAAENVRPTENPPAENTSVQENVGDSQAQGSATGNARQKTVSTGQETSARVERLRIFQTSTPVTRTVTRFQKAAIVVRGENGKQLVELLWRDQMNEKTRDIWDFLVKKFRETESLDRSEVSIRKKEILDGSGVKSDRTFISAIYTLEDMGLIEVKRLSGNKEGNIYALTDEGREEIDATSSVKSLYSS
jgi:hypothetical protein